MLSEIADDASERTTDRYEGDAALEGAELRIWFGLVPPGSGGAPWRDVVQELAPIPLETITGR